MPLFNFADQLVALLLTEVSAARDGCWTLARVQSVLGPKVSLEACRRVMERLERIRAVRRIDTDVWQPN